MQMLTAAWERCAGPLTSVPRTTLVSSPPLQEALQLLRHAAQAQHHTYYMMDPTAPHCNGMQMLLASPCGCAAVARPAAGGSECIEGTYTYNTQGNRVWIQWVQHAQRWRCCSTLEGARPNQASATQPQRCQMAAVRGPACRATPVA